MKKPKASVDRENNTVVMDMIDKIKKIKVTGEDLNNKINDLRIHMDNLQKEYKEHIINISDSLRISNLDETILDKFLREPYAIVPTGKVDEWFVIVPKFIKMNLGWLDFTTSTYNVFRINKFMNWLGEIPQNLQNKFKFKPKIPIKIFDGMVLTGEHQDETWNRYKHYLQRRIGKDKIKIKRGYEFKLIAKLIDDGILPFIPKPVQKEDLREPDIGFELRDYQKEARSKFLKTGAVGIYWSYSAGKTFFGMYECAEIKGRKLIVVPTRTLVEQWNDRLKKYTKISNEIDIITYHSFHKVQNNEYSLVIFDEVHHLPANQFSKFSTIKAKYRIGLSGSPYREDGRTDYIFALSGFPIGLNWENLIELGIIEEPNIRLYIFKDRFGKIKKLKELLGIQKKTIIFCDSIKLGQSLSKKFEIPFVYGATRDRIEVIKESDTTIVSRVGDEGLSIPDIERVIEFDFLFGSRRQESQRMGRLFHGEKKGEHIILMTEKEYEGYSKRLYSIIEKGFKIEIVR
ncbi:MAG: DEAD/DEAH box helicase [Promethearchaeota archaeon]